MTHFTCLILVDAILIYDMIEHGFDIVTFAVFFGGYSQLLIVCSCGEFINQKVGGSPTVNLARQDINSFLSECLFGSGGL